ncbi:MAG TPA: hypothetical protein VFH95_06830 [Candidatus Kapabacteria bacterium]|nr:hypothetical protein [Candidatus Kapabacteria bacterium]
MTPNEIARKVITRARDTSRHDSMFQDSLAKEIANAITEERELLSRYLTFLNESIAFEPQLVRHRLLMGSTRISTGQFLDEMQPDERKSYALRLNTAHGAYYARG